LNGPRSPLSGRHATGATATWSASSANCN